MYESDDDPDDPNDNADDRYDADVIMEMDPLHPRYRYIQENHRLKMLRIIRRRRLRDSSDPFDVTYKEFVGSYRLSQYITRSLIDLIRPFMRNTSSPQAVPLHLKVLSVLSFYASGSYQTPTGKQFDCPIARSTISAFIDEVTEALNEDEVLSHLIRFPSNVEEVNYCIERNRQLGGKIDNVLAYTDGSLFKIMKPSVENNRQAFIGRKSFASINAQITCDRRYYIMNVLARYPGSTNDSFIFSGSALRRRMIQLYDVRRCHLLGDSGYALELWMMVPFDRPAEDTPESRFNQKHCSDRNIVERCIGLLKVKFRCLNDERVLHYNYVKVCKMINAAVVLHNLGVLCNIPHFIDEDELQNNNVNEEGPEVFDGDDDVNEPDDDVDEPDLPGIRRNAAAVLALGQQVRQEIVAALERQ